MFKMEGIKDNIDAALVCEDWGSTREPSMGNFKELMQPGLWIQNFRAHVNHQLRDNLNVTLV